MIAVRLAGPGDAPVLAEMRYAFRSEMAVPTEPETRFLERVARWLANRLGGGVWTGWIACASGDPVGLVLVQLVEKVPNPVPEAEYIGYVSSLYVRPRWRGRAIPRGPAAVIGASRAATIGCVDKYVLPRREVRPWPCTC